MFSLCVTLNPTFKIARKVLVFDIALIGPVDDT